MIIIRIICHAVRHDVIIKRSPIVQCRCATIFSPSRPPSLDVLQVIFILSIIVIGVIMLIGILSDIINSPIISVDIHYNFFGVTHIEIHPSFLSKHMHIRISNVSTTSISRTMIGRIVIVASSAQYHTLEISTR